MKIDNGFQTMKVRNEIEKCLKTYLKENYGDVIKMRVVEDACSKDTGSWKVYVPLYKKRMSAKKLDSITHDLLKIQGLTPEYFDNLALFKEKFFDGETMGELSIDSNANKSEKTTRALLTEIQNSSNKLIGYYFLYEKMKELYGKKNAQRLMGELYSYTLSINDSTNILIPYCFAMDASSIITVGRQFGQLWSKPVKRLSSYVSVLNEVAHSFTNQIAGALAVATFFTDAAYVLHVLEGYSLDDIKNDVEISAHSMDGDKEGKERKLMGVRKYTENCMESFVYSMNALTRITYESPFTNISIFSPDKLRQILSDEGRDWYLESVEIEGKPDATKEEKLDYMIDYVMELQDIYMDFFDKGDPLKGGANYRFPVTTINVSKVKVGENDDGTEKFDIEPRDIDFVKNDITKRELYRYNNMISIGAQVASCCFAGRTEVPVKINGSKSYVKKTLKALCKMYEENPETSFKVYQYGNWVDAVPVKVVADHNLYDMKYKITLTNGTVLPLSTRDHLHMVTGKVFKKSFQLSTRDCVYIDKSWYNRNDKLTCVRIKSITQAPDVDKYVYCMQITDPNIKSYDCVFTLACGLVTHNCRLITDVGQLNAYGAQVNSFGGSMTSYGSHRVVPINFPRIAYEATSVEDFIHIENDRIEDAVMILNAHRELLKVTCSGNRHPFFKNGWMDLRRLFSTIGVLGVAEAVDVLIKKINSGEIPYPEDWSQEMIDSEDLHTYLMTRILTNLSEKVHRYSEDSEFRNPFNIEQIPAEAMATRLCDADKTLFGDSDIPYQLYSNQFIPLWEKGSLWERMKEDGKYNQLFSGGGIVHFNLGERTTPEQNYEIYQYAVETGCEHFALNPVYSLCSHNHYSFGKFTTCPVCGGKIVDYYTRVVGFFTPVSAWNKVRKNWEFQRRDFTGISDLEIQKQEKNAKESFKNNSTKTA